MLTSQDRIRDDELSRESAAVVGLQGGALLECFEVGHDAGGLLIRQVEVGHLRAGLLAGRIEDPALEILRAVVRERAAGLPDGAGLPASAGLGCARGGAVVEALGCTSTAVADGLAACTAGADVTGGSAAGPEAAGVEVDVDGPHAVANRTSAPSTAARRTCNNGQLTSTA